MQLAFPTSSGPTILLRHALIGVVVIIASILSIDATYKTSGVLASKKAMQYKRLLVMHKVAMVSSCQWKMFVITGRNKKLMKLMAV